MRSRPEHDLLGERVVPQSAHYGIHTLRASENFAISTERVAGYPSLVVALAAIKQAAALANCELGILSREKCSAIARARRTACAPPCSSSSSTCCKAVPAPRPP